MDPASQVSDDALQIFNVTLQKNEALMLAGRSDHAADDETVPVPLGLSVLVLIMSVVISQRSKVCRNCSQRGFPLMSQFTSVMVYSEKRKYCYF